MAYEFTRENHVRDGVAWLIKKANTRDANGVVKPNQEERRQVYTSEGCIYQKEFYDGHASGIKPQMKITIFRGDYKGERIVECYDEVLDKLCRYAVYRTYPTGDLIELYLRDDLGEWTN